MFNSLCALPAKRRHGGLLAIAGQRICALFLLVAMLLFGASAVHSQTVTEYSAGISVGAKVTDIAKGPDGNLWFTENATDRIGRITPNGVVTVFSIGITPGARPTGITAGPDGNMWFTEYAGNRIGRITPLGVVTEFSVGITANAHPNYITAGPDGALWFTEYSIHRIGRITTSGVVTEYSSGMTLGAFPERITLGPDGNLWFTEYTGNRIGKIGVEGGITEYRTGISAGAGLEDITAGPDGNLWFTETSGNRIGRITPNGVVTEFSAGISPGAGLVGITSGPDGNLWFTEYSGNRIGRITPTGVVTEFNSGITANANPNYIVKGPDGNLWFTEQGINRVGKFAFELTVAVNGNGTGTVTSAPAAINCPTACRASFTSGTLVTLTATPNSGSTFTGWGGDCTGTGACTVNMATSHFVTATFSTPVTFYGLTVTKSGTGSGTATSAPAAINCGSTCSASFASGTNVTLTVALDPGSTFIGWSGDCTGTGNCTVSMTASKNVTANFGGATAFRGLSVSVLGTGAGTVNSTPSGISCVTFCSAQFFENALVTLSATPGAGATFVGWSGDCTGPGACTVKMSASRSVFATFKAKPFSVSTTGVTNGVITASIATVVNTIAFNPADIGKTGSVFVTAVAPASFIGSIAGSPNQVRSLNAVVPASSSGLTLLQLTSSGWERVVNGQLIPYASGVLGDQLAAQNILNNTNTSGLLGSQFCVGYGTSAAEMSAAGRMQLVATILDPAAQGTSSLSCLVTDTLLVQPGWNLLGNSVNQSFPVTNLYSDATWVSSVWKWDAVQKVWQFYAPSMSATELLSYAREKGYAVLADILPGDGYWVNAGGTVSVAIQSGTASNLTATSLSAGWNLVTTGAAQTPAALNSTLSANIPSGSSGFSSVWAWDTTTGGYYFYAPSLQTQGGNSLLDYIRSHGYLDFTAASRSLTPGAGFWVYMP